MDVRNAAMKARLDAYGRQADAADRDAGEEMRSREKAAQ